MLTFTAGFERQGYSEIDRAQETAAALGVKSVPCVITAEEFFTHLPRIIWHLDDPMADAAAVPLWFVAREASRHVKVVLSGEGSDELFGGYADLPPARPGPRGRAAPRLGQGAAAQGGRDAPGRRQGQGPARTAPPPRCGAATSATRTCSWTARPTWWPGPAGRAPTT